MIDLKKDADNGASPEGEAGDEVPEESVEVMPPPRDPVLHPRRAPNCAAPRTLR